MSQPIQRPGSSSRGERAPQKLPESEVAYQTPSEGPRLPRTGWGWFVYIITFQWVASLFSEPKTAPLDARRQHISQLVDRTQDLLQGNLSSQDQQIFQKWLNLAPSAWLAQFAQFLNEASRIEQLKGDGDFILLGTARAQTIGRLSQQVMAADDAAFSVFLRSNPMTFNPINAILDSCLASNTQPIEDGILAAVPDPRASQPYLFRPTGSHLLFEVRRDQRMLHITDPKTKATRTVQFGPDMSSDPKIAKEFRHYQYAQALYSLSHPPAVDPKLTRLDYLRAGNIYVYEVDYALGLSLSPRLIDAADLGFSDRGPILAARDVIKSGAAGTIRLLITAPAPEEIMITPSKEEKLWVVTYAWKDKTYVTKYPKQGNETFAQLATRIALDRTLERDLLLARSFFVRETT